MKNRLWTWTENQQSAFNKTKELLTLSPVLTLFDPNLETAVSADASSFGLSAVLKQKNPDGEYKPVAYISRSLTPTEQRYAQIEKEALAFTWACERLSDYLIGLPFHIWTDHKPLVPLFSTKELEQIPIRVQRYRLRMMRFSFTIAHRPGKELIIADALSRSPSQNSTDPDSDLLHQEADAFVRMVMQSLPATENRIKQIRDCQQQDETCKLVTSYCLSSALARQEVSTKFSETIPTTCSRVERRWTVDERVSYRYSPVTATRNTDQDSHGTPRNHQMCLACGNSS